MGFDGMLDEDDMLFVDDVLWDIALEELDCVTELEEVVGLGGTTTELEELSIDEVVGLTALDDVVDLVGALEDVEEP